MQNVLDGVVRASDLELVGRLEKLVKADRVLSAELLVHLGEVDTRKLYCERSFSSMFEYCRSGLGMSESEAYLRLLAARVGRKFPLVLERLAAGAVHLSAIKMLSPHFTQENHAELLDRVRGRSKRQIEVVVAGLAPKPDVPARMRKLPAQRASLSSSVSTALSSAAAAVDVPPTAAGSSAAPVLLGAAACGSMTAPVVGVPEAPAAAFALESPSRARCAPLRPGRFKLDLTLGQEGHDALEQLVELLRHQNPSGDLASIVERALKELLERTIKQRFGQAKTARPRPTRKPAATAPDTAVNAETDVRKRRSRHIPKAVRHAVFTRDGGQCTYESADGRRCTERGFLEVHHHNTTFARGGEATAENLRLACRAHNLFMAEQDYGRVFMEKKLHETRGQENLAHRSNVDSGHARETSAPNN